MNLFSWGALLTMLVIIAISTVIAIISYYIYRKSNYDLLEGVSFTISVIEGMVAGCTLIILCFFAAFCVHQRYSEKLCYQTNVELRANLQQAISASTDVVNTDLYLKAVDFNADLARTQNAQKDTRYSLSFSGDVDWSTIKPIDLN